MPGLQTNLRKILDTTRKTMLNTLLSVIRAILVELVDQLLRKVCTLG